MSVSEVPIQARGMVADEWFERAERVPMSKAPVRAMVISLLSPLSGVRILEIGSGSGAMTVELLRAAGKNGRVTSIEVSPLAAGVTKRNIERSGMADRAELITGRAPKHIPQTSYGVVFIGGHGNDLEPIIGTCWDRLELGGRMLLTAITPLTTSRALVYLEGLGAAVGFWRMHAAAGRNAGSDWLLMGHNPIDIVWGDK